MLSVIGEMLITLARTPCEENSCVKVGCYIREMTINGEMRLAVLKEHFTHSVCVCVCGEAAEHLR